MDEIGDSYSQTVYWKVWFRCIEEKRLAYQKIVPTQNLTPPYAHPQDFSLAATAVKHSQFIWSQLVVQEDFGVSSLKIDQNLWRPF